MRSVPLDDLAPARRAPRRRAATDTNAGIRSPTRRRRIRRGRGCAARREGRGAPGEPRPCRAPAGARRCGATPCRGARLPRRRSRRDRRRRRPRRPSKRSSRPVICDAERREAVEAEVLASVRAAQAGTAARASPPRRRAARRPSCRSRRAARASRRCRGRGTCAARASDDRPRGRRLARQRGSSSASCCPLAPAPTTRTGPSGRRSGRR